MRSPRSKRLTSVRWIEARKLSPSWEMLAPSRRRARFCPKRSFISGVGGAVVGARRFIATSSARLRFVEGRGRCRGARNAGTPYLPVACASALDKPQAAAVSSLRLRLLEGVGARVLLGLAHLALLLQPGEAVGDGTG